MADATFPYDFFVSRRGVAADVAQEVAQVLEEKGYKVIVQDFDIPFSTNFVAGMQDAVTKARHFIGILTEDYDSSPFTRDEWTSFYALSRRSGGQRRLVLLRVQNVDPPGLLAPIVYGDLFGVFDTEKRRQIIVATAEGRSIGKRAGTQVFGGVPPRNPDFTGREALLGDLHNKLTGTDQPAAITQAAIHGLGGIGKTSLAIEYAHRHKDDYVGIWWAPAENRTVLLTSLAELARLFDPKLAGETDVEKVAKGGLASLASSTRPWLLVYDNASRPTDIRDLIPSTGSRLLITSRWTNWAGRAVEVEVATLEPKEAIDLLLKLTGRSDRKGAGRLAHALGYLPLALDHAGAYLKLTGIAFDRYAVRYQDLIAEAPEDAAYPESVGATFSLAIEKVADQQGSEDILALLSVLAPERIPLELVDDIVREETRRDKALMSLSAVSLIRHDNFSDDSVAISIHRLVQAAMRTRLKAVGALTAIVETAVERLATVFPLEGHNDLASWARCEKLLPHVMALRTLVSESGILTRYVVILFSRTANYLWARGAYSLSEPIFRDSVAFGEKLLGREHPEVGILLNNLTLVLMETGQYEEAEKVLRGIIAITEQSLGREHPDMAIWLNNLATVLMETSNFEEAETLLRESIAAGDKSLGREHPAMAERLNNLGYVLKSTGRAVEAEHHYREAIAIWEKGHGDPGHPSQAARLNNLANLLSETGRDAEAESLWRQAISDEVRSLGPDHPQIGLHRTNLASFLIERGLFDAAQDEAAQAVAILEAARGVDHALTVAARSTLKKALRHLDSGR